MGLAVGILSALVGANCALTAATTFDITDGAVRVRDVVDPACLQQELAGAGELVVAVLPRSAQRMELTREALARLAQRRVPGLAGLVVSNPQAPITLLRASTSQAQTAPLQCWASKQALRAGQALTHDAVAAVVCETSPGAALHYEDGIVRVESDLPAGAYLGRFARAPRAMAEAGETLVFRAAVGPVVVERQVQAVRSSNGQRVFVRDAEGEVFSLSQSALEHRGRAP